MKGKFLQRWKENWTLWVHLEAENQDPTPLARHTQEIIRTSERIAVQCIYEFGQSLGILIAHENSCLKLPAILPSYQVSGGKLVEDKEFTGDHMSSPSFLLCLRSHSSIIRGIAKCRVEEWGRVKGDSWDSSYWWIRFSFPPGLKLDLMWLKGYIWLWIIVVTNLYLLHVFKIIYVIWYISQ